MSLQLCALGALGSSAFLFLSFAIDGRLLRFQLGLASRSGSLRFVGASRSANTRMRQVTAKLAHQLADGTADSCAAIPVFPQRLRSPRRIPLGPSAANADSSRTGIVKDWYYIKRINGLSRLKEKINLCGEFGNEE